MSWWKWLLGIGGAGGAAAAALIANEALKDGDVVTYTEPPAIASNIMSDPAFNDADRARFEGGAALPPAESSGDGGGEPKDVGPKTGDDNPADSEAVRSQTFREPDLDQLYFSTKYSWDKETLEKYRLHELYLNAAEAAAFGDQMFAEAEFRKEVRKKIEEMRGEGSVTPSCLENVGRGMMNDARGVLYRVLFREAFENEIGRFRMEHKPDELDELPVEFIEWGKEYKVHPDDIKEAMDIARGYIQGGLSSYVDGLVRLVQKSRSEYPEYSHDFHLKEGMKVVEGFERLGYIDRETCSRMRDAMAAILLPDMPDMPGCGFEGE